MKDGKNRSDRRSRIGEAKFRQLVRAVDLDLTATQAAPLTGFSTRRTNDISLKLRRRIAQHCQERSPYRGEVDESYFGPSRVKGKRGRGAGGKTIVFGIFKRNGDLDTEIVPDAKKATLTQAIHG